MDYDIVEIDPNDDAMVEAYWATGDAAERFENPYAAFWPLRTARAALQRANNAFKIVPLAAVDARGAVIATCQVNLPQLDNTHLAYAGPKVLSEHRRKGIATALMQETFARCRDDRRTTVIVEAAKPLADDSSPGLDFLNKLGFEVGISGVHRVLDLPVPTERLGELAAAAAPHHGDYRLVQFSDEFPEEYLEGYCALQTVFNAEAPSGDLDVELEVWDAARVRSNEDLRRRQGTWSETTLAVAPDGTVAGLTELIISDEGRGNCMQGGTIVLRPYRGHRLGLAVKVANLAALQHRLPDVRLIHSWNAEENEHMAAINAELGFRPVEVNVEMMLRL